MKTDALVQRLVDSYGSWVTDDSAVRAGCAGMTQNLYPYTSMFSPIRLFIMQMHGKGGKP